MGRIRSLDGLRGVAALAVVICHSLVVFPWLRAIHTDDHPLAPGTLSWWITHTPLHLAWIGTEAVYVFFILSGVVLTLPVLDARKYSWRDYYPRRIVRLYLPVLVSLAIALAVIFIVGLFSPGASAAWMQARDTVITPVRLFRDAILVTGTSGVNGPLWSLQWEVLFSLLLPAYIFCVTKWRQLWVIKFVGIFVLAFAGSTVFKHIHFVGDALLYMSMFALGSLMAAEYGRFHAFAEQLDKSRRPPVSWGALTVAGLLLLCSYWTVLAFSPSSTTLNSTRVFELLGAGILVFVAAFWSGARRFLEAGVVQWLGLVSFSLYLVHDPILAALNYLLPPDRLILVMVVGIPVALLAAHFFYKFVESPSHRLAKRIRFSPRDTPVAATGEAEAAATRN